MSQQKAIVIGAGIGGLAGAIRLAVKGFSVTVFERNNYPGGKLSAFRQDGYAFDAGPSLFTQPQNIEELFTLAGVPIEDYLQYERVDIACHYFFENGKQVRAFAQPDAFARDMHQQLGEDELAVKKYLVQSEKAYTNIGDFFLNHSLHHWKTYVNRKILKTLAHSKIAYIFKSLNNYNAGKFKTPEAVQLFNRYATYNGSNPFKAPAMLSLIPHLEFNEGTFYPKGGMISITNAIFKLAVKLGVQFKFDTGVEAIIQNQGSIKGVVAKGENYKADVVVSNCDVYFTYKHLLKDDFRAARLLRQERSSSALIFYWGMGKTFQQLGLHNIFFSAAYKNEFEQIFNQGLLSDDPTVYINITSKMEQGQAPAGKENWFVMINAPANTTQDWEALKQAARRNIILKLNRLLGTDIEPLIETEAILDPVTIESTTNSYQGSLYGTSSNGRLSAFLRHANFTRQIKGLFFVGGSVHPGGGIPLCLKSAQIMGNLVKN